MKKLILILIAFFAVISSSNAQIIIGKRAAEKHRYATQKEEGWDIVLDPIETTPKKKISNKRMAALIASNWGHDLILPNDIRIRLDNECRYPVVVKVGDTGDPNHDYLRTGHLPPANYSSAATAEDKQGHSTHVCGIIAAGELGVLELLVSKGIVQYKACKILGDQGSGSFDWVANMFTGEFSNDTFLLNHGTFVVYNMSLGGGTAKVASIETAMKKSTDAGVFIAVANGNTGGRGVQYPGNSIYVIGTASLDQNPLQRSSYSTYGPETQLAMPGRSINSTYLNNTFASLSGTSMATPFATSAIAIARSKWGAKLKSVEHLRAFLAKCATDISPAGRDEYTGWGIEFIKNILDTNPDSIGSTPPPPPPVVNPDSTLRETRTLTFSLKGEWKMYYNPTLSVSPKKKSKVQPDGRILEGEELRFFLENNANAILTITSIDVALTTNYFFPLAQKTLLDATNWFFTNRGLQLVGNTDLVDGVNWSAYFYDLLLYSQRGKIDVNVIRIEGKDATGRAVYLDGTSLKRYTPPK